MDDLITFLESRFEIKKISGKKVAILTNGNRVELLESLEKELKGSKYDPTPRSDSSVGRLEYNGLTVIAKPASKQGRGSPGVENEDTLVKHIQNATETGPVNVIFKGKNKNFEILGCAGVKLVGGDVKGRKKADVTLIDSKGVEFPISIKKDNAEIWESADSYYSAKAEKAVEKAVKQGLVELTFQGYFKVSPELAIKATRAEKMDVVFGSDLGKNGAVITKTFTSSSFKLHEDSLEIDVSHIITDLSDVNGPKDVVFLIRNDKTRKSVKKYPGLRVLAAYQSRAKNAKVLK